MVFVVAVIVIGYDLTFIITFIEFVVLVMTRQTRMLRESIIDFMNILILEALELKLYLVRHTGKGGVRDSRSGFQ